MPKGTRATRALPVLLAEQLRKLGRDIAVARKRRRLSMAAMAERMMVSVDTVQRLEKGDPAVGIGIVATALWVLGLQGRLNDLVAPETDVVGLQEEIRHQPRDFRKRGAQKSPTDDPFDNPDF